MRVRFGLHRDVLDPTLPRSAVGEITVGPRRFLELLESDLGIGPTLAHPSEELTLYRACLEELDDFGRFYNQSFQVDPVGVARTLCDWRHEWYLHGWDGAFPSGAGQRLEDMAAVETLATTRVTRCAGQRLQAVLELLDSRRVQVDEVELLDAVDDLPPMWRRVIEHFDCRSVTEAAMAPSDSDLGKLQTLLLNGRVQQLRSDGSLVVIRAFSRDVTAQATAEIVRALPDRRRVVVVADRDGIVVDNAFERVGLPRAGFQHYSPFRSAAQVLKLTLALVWEPLDPHRLLQFLIHPVSPLPWRVRGRLAEAVAAQPGIGGPAWCDAMTELADDAGNIEFWTSPARFAVADGVPLDFILERVRRCIAWLAQRLALAEAGEERAVYRAAFAQADALAANLKRRLQGGTTKIAKVELDALVDDVSRGAPDPSIIAEAGHVPATSHPANVTERVDEVLWWDLAPSQLDLTSPWSASERATLAEAGVELPTPEDRLAADKRAWQRPVLNCQKRLVLVVHDEGQGRHPLWGRIQEQFGNGWVDVPLDHGLLQGDGDVAGRLGIRAPPLEQKRLPGPRRWWHLDRAIPARGTESYTSLNKVCNYPHEWVLTYAARLGSGGINEVADGAMLKGSLAHRLFERFFTEHGTWQDLSGEAVDRWLAETIDDLITKEGAVLLENGRGVDRQQVVTTLERALRRLLDHLDGANVREVQSELPLAKAFAGGTLMGEADLVLVSARGERAVLDAKWGSEPYRLKEIEDGKHLQLAVYGYSLAEPAWPSTGYYIVTTGNVLAPDTGFFPTAIGTGGDDVESIWRRCLVTRDWRLEQFERGVIEVNAGAEPDADSQTPSGALEIAEGPDRFDEFHWLTGVEPFR
ncbi:MAG: PD-(D/E)XK nuclease family protein [Gammaproteobacteria bacterium]|nr:PD-(D/E)XK nuclease family protein [Gammaproteobacteria bacterium]